MINETLAHYEILEKIGQGSMGEVYRARDSKLKRDVGGNQLMVVSVELEPEIDLGEPAALFDIDPQMDEIDVTPDGQLFVGYSPIAGSLPATTVVLNWASELSQ